MRFLSIASGSSGNCIYVGNETDHFLIDDGIPGKRVLEGLHSIGLTPEDLTGILITHEHADHIKGLGVLLRKCEIPVYATADTIECMLSFGQLGRVNGELFHPIKNDQDLSLGSMTIHPFSVPHDAADPVAYRLSDSKKKLAVVTDLGAYDEGITGELKDLDMVMVEANHDIRMLQLGPYPYPLKTRILGNRGHLCNEAAGQLIAGILHDGIKHIVLGHLSKENNYPLLAEETVKLEIDGSDNTYKASDFPLDVAPRDICGKLYEI